MCRQGCGSSSSGTTAPTPKARFPNRATATRPHTQQQASPQSSEPGMVQVQGGALNTRGSESPRRIVKWCGGFGVSAPELRSSDVTGPWVEVCKCKLDRGTSRHHAWVLLQPSVSLLASLCPTRHVGEDGGPWILFSESWMTGAGSQVHASDCIAQPREDAFRESIQCVQSWTHPAKGLRSQTVGEGS